jgi:hypothetical protein
MPALSPRWRRLAWVELTDSSPRFEVNVVADRFEVLGYVEVTTLEAAIEGSLLRLALVSELSIAPLLKSTDWPLMEAKLGTRRLAGTSSLCVNLFMRSDARVSELQGGRLSIW